MAIIQSDHAPVASPRRTRRRHWSMIRWSAVAGGVGGLIGWAPGELLNLWQDHGSALALYTNVFLYFFVISACIGAALGALPGIMNRSRSQIARGAMLGGLIGGIGGGLGGLPAQFMFNALGNGLLARAVGWAIVGTAIGLCPGAVSRDRGRALRGMIGGFAGGFTGGLLFNLVGYILAGAGTGSRLAADLVVGLCIGVMVALVETALKKAWLTVVSGRREGAQFILSKEITAIGRDDRDDVLLWGDELLSLRHASIRRTRDGYMLDSLAPTAHTLVNGRSLTGTAPLNDGDEIVLGATRLVFNARDSGPEQPAAPAAPVRPPAYDLVTPQGSGWNAIASAASPRQGHAPATAETIAFRLVACDGASGIYVLPQRAVISIGRAPTNDIVLDHPSVSGLHAELRWDEGRWVVIDKHSTNGTYVSYSGAPDAERRVARNALKDGSTLRFGEVTWRVEGVHAP